MCAWSVCGHLSGAKTGTYVDDFCWFTIICYIIICSMTMLCVLPARRLVVAAVQRKIESGRTRRERCSGGGNGGGGGGRAPRNFNFGREANFNFSRGEGARPQQESQPGTGRCGERQRRPGTILLGAIGVLLRYTIGSSSSGIFLPRRLFLERFLRRFVTRGILRALFTLHVHCVLHRAVAVDCPRGWHRLHAVFSAIYLHACIVYRVICIRVCREGPAAMGFSL